MDKRTVLAFLFIGLILIITQTTFYRKLVNPDYKPGVATSYEDSSTVRTDSISGMLTKEEPESSFTKKKIQQQESVSFNSENELARIFQSNDSLNYEDVIIETDYYVARINPRGAVISSWILKNYYYNGKDQVQLIKDEGYGNLGIFFINNEDTIYSYNTVFEPDKKEIRFTNDQLTDSIRFTFNLGERGQLIKTFKFYKDQYIIDLNVEIKNLATQFENNQYYLSWNSGLAYTEWDYSNYISKEDINNTKAYVFQGGSKEELKFSKNKPFQKKSRSDFSGVVDWAAIRTKYFAMIILPGKNYNIEPHLYGTTTPLYSDQQLRERVIQEGDNQNLEVRVTKLKSKLNDRIKKDYSIELKTSVPPSHASYVSQKYRVYIGPLDYDIIKNYHPTLSKIMDFGFSIFRPFAKLVLNAFTSLHSFIPNYGVVLIVFSILVKILVYPLTKKSYVSMQKMQTLQPRMNELKEKYGKDPQRLNKETMKLYKESGVNPLSGCLPTLLQLPLLWAIFIVFRNTIELRDAAFIWWIKDLSAPDTIFQLDFTIPLYGDLVNVLPLFMGVTMFIQQKMTMKDPKQKTMVYMMPIFLTLIFNSFPSGLNLYYALFNLFSIIQQKWTPKKEIEAEVTTKKSIQPKRTKGKNKSYKRR